MVNFGAATDVAAAAAAAADDDDDDDVGGGQTLHTFLSFHKRRSLDRCARTKMAPLLLSFAGQFGEG